MNAAPITAESARAYARARAQMAPPKDPRPFVGSPIATLATPVQS